MIERAFAPMPRPQGGFFGGERARFGWLHRPAVAGGIGLVIVPPFGYEAVCAHRALRHLAEQAARAGVIAVRFDLDGTGDSDGDDLEPARLESWLASVADACEVARGAGAERIVLAGVRMGATLAALAAARRDDVAGLVAIAAVPSGKALVREGRALQMQLGLAPAPAGIAAPPEDQHELVGYALTAETRGALSAIDLVKATRAPAESVLVIDRDDLAGNDKWVAALRALGADVEQQRLPGYVEMVMDPHKAQVPARIVDATLAYVQGRAAALPDAAVAARSEAAAGRVTISPRSAGGDELVWLDEQLIAMATHPRHAPRRAVILLNSGAIGRVGPNRLYVALARRLAERGDLVLRLDLAGLGDSHARPGAAENTVYPDDAIEDVEVAVTWARQHGAREIALVGLCSGAYHALKAASADLPVTTIVPINPLTFYWKPGMPLDFAAFRVTQDAQRYQKSMKSVESWKKLLRGDVNVKRVARVIVERARSIAEHRARDVARQLRVPLREDLGTDLLALGRKNIAMRFVFAAGDPGHAMLLEQGGSAVSRLERAGKLSVDVIDGPDHTFTPRWSHPVLLDTIVRALR